MGEAACLGSCPISKADIKTIYDAIHEVSQKIEVNFEEQNQINIHLNATLKHLEATITKVDASSNENAKDLMRLRLEVEMLKQDQAAFKSAQGVELKAVKASQNNQGSIIEKHSGWIIALLILVLGAEKAASLFL